MRRRRASACESKSPPQERDALQNHHSRTRRSLESARQQLLRQTEWASALGAINGASNEYLAAMGRPRHRPRARQGRRRSVGRHRPLDVSRADYPRASLRANSNRILDRSPRRVEEESKDRQQRRIEARRN